MTKYLLLPLSLLMGSISAAVAQDQTDQGTQWAVIIAVQKHEATGLNNLRFTQRDAMQLRRVLVERGGVPAGNIVEVIDAAADGNRRPTLDNIRRQLRAVLSSSNIRANDRVLVYFTGHGGLENKQTYLVPSDAKPKDLKRSSFPVSELHELLKNCQAGNKLLVLDCCFAGGELEKSLNAPTGDDFIDAVKADDIPGCVVMASSTKREKSLEWRERQQGLFSYWFCKGLEGGADADGNGTLTLSELYGYTSQRVERTARQVFQRRQSPVRYVNFDVQGDPTVLTLLHEHPETVCHRLAAHLDLDAREHGLKKIGFLEFRTPIDNKDGLARANLPRIVADRIRIAMNVLRNNAYELAEDADVSKAANSKALTIEGIGEPQSLATLQDEIEELDAVVWGRLDRSGSRINLQCELLRVSDSERLATPTGSFPLSDDLFGDWGASFDNTDSPNADTPFAPEVIQHIDQQSRTPPTQKDDFPFRVEIWSLKPRAGEAAVLIDDEHVITPTGRLSMKKGTRFQVERIESDIITGQFHSKGRPVSGKVSLRNAKAASIRKEFLLTPGNVERNKELLVAAEMDELFEIRIQNRLGTDVAMTLLVDGINTRGMEREFLGQAKSWVIPPTGKDSYRVVEGWYPEIDVEKIGPEHTGTTLQRFRFGRPSNAVASRLGFGDSLGVITAAFYAASGRAVGVEAGPEEYRKLEMKTFRPGKLLGVVNLRYLDASELEDE